MADNTGRMATVLLILAAWLFASFLRLHWVQEAHLPGKANTYQINGELLPTTHDSYLFGSIIQKGHLGMHSGNPEVPAPHEHGPITWLPVILLNWFNGPAFHDLTEAADEFGQASQHLSSSIAAEDDNSTKGKLLANSLKDAQAMRAMLLGIHPTPHHLKENSRSAAEAARKTAQTLHSAGYKNKAVHAALASAQDHALSAIRRPMISVESIMAYMPAFAASLLAVPLVLIGRLLGSAWWGFLAALTGSVAYSYYNRSMSGYFDTDMFSVTVPAVALYFLLRSLCNKEDWSAGAGAVALFLMPFFYTSSMSIALAMAVAYIGYQLVFHWREARAWEGIVPVAVAMFFLGGSQGHVIAVNPAAWVLKIAAIFCASLAPRWMPWLRVESEWPGWPLRAGVAAMLVGVVLFSSPFEQVRQKVFQYLPTETAAANPSGAQLQYKNVISTVQEARGVNKTIWAVRISGTVAGFGLTVLGFALLIARHPQMLISLPLVGIGLFSLMGGLRFTIHAVGIAALAATWVFFAREGCRLGRTIVCSGMGGLAGAAIWLWVAWLSGQRDGALDVLFLPSGLLAGLGAAMAGLKGQGDAPTRGQRAWIAIIGAGTGVITAKTFAASLQMGPLMSSLGVLSLAPVLIAGAIPIVLSAGVLSRMGNAGAWLQQHAFGTHARVLAACLGMAALAGLALGHLTHVPADSLYARMIQQRQNPHILESNPNFRPVTLYQSNAFSELEKSFVVLRPKWRQSSIDLKTHEADLGALHQSILRNPPPPTGQVYFAEFVSFLRESRANASFKTLLTSHGGESIEASLTAASSQPPGVAGIVLGALIGIAGAWAARGGSRLFAAGAALGFTLLGLAILLAMKSGYLSIQMAGIFAGSGLGVVLIAPVLASVIALGLPWPEEGLGGIGRTMLALMTATGLGWLWLGTAVGHPLLQLLVPLGLLAGWWMAHESSPDQRLHAAVFAGLSILGMVGVAQLTASQILSAPLREISGSIEVWVWALLGATSAGLTTHALHGGFSLRLKFAHLSILSVLAATVMVLVLVTAHRAAASLLPSSPGTMALLENLGLWAMGATLGVVIWCFAKNDLDYRPLFLAGGITVLGGAAFVIGVGGLDGWAFIPRALWLLIAGLTAALMPLALSGENIFKKMTAGLAMAIGAGVMWALMSKAAPQTLPLSPVCLLAGGAVAFAGKAVRGWISLVLAATAAILAMLAGLFSFAPTMELLRDDNGLIPLSRYADLLLGLAATMVPAALNTNRTRDIAAGLVAAGAGGFVWAWAAAVLGGPAAGLLLPLGVGVGFAMARHAPDSKNALRQAGAAAALVGLVCVGGLLVISGENFAEADWLWPGLAILAAPLMVLAIQNEEMPGQTVVASLAAALVAGLAWGWLGREMNVMGRPDAEPLTLGPMVVGALTGMAVAWRGQRGWLPPLAAALAALLGVGAGVLVMGSYGLQPLDELSRSFAMHEHFNVGAMTLGLVTLLGMATAAGIALLRERVGTSLLAAVGGIGLLAPHVLHARDQARAIGPVLDRPSVELLEVMGKVAKPGDFMMTWWDYGTAGWFHGNCNVIVHPGNQTDDVWVASRVLGGSNPREGANLSRLAIESYAQRGPLALNHIFKGNLAPGDDKNKDGLDDWSRLPSVDKLSPEAVLASLTLPPSVPGTNAPPKSYDPPEPTRDIFLYLPTKLLPIYPVIMQFSRRDLMSAQREFENALFQMQSGSGRTVTPQQQATANRLLLHAAEKGHAEAQVSLANREFEKHKKQLPPMFKDLPAAVENGDPEARQKLAHMFAQQQKMGRTLPAANAHLWASRATAMLTRTHDGSRNHSPPSSSFSNNNTDSGLDLARNLRDKIALYLPAQQVANNLENAAIFKPRGAQFANPHFQPVSLRYLQNKNQPPLMRFGDRFLADSSDLRIFEDITPYSDGTARIRGEIHISPQRVAAAMETIRNAARAMRESNPSSHLLAPIASALQAIHPRAVRQETVAKLRKILEDKNAAGLEAEAVTAFSLHIQAARDLWTRKLPSSLWPRHRDGPQFWAVTTQDGRTIVGEIDSLSANGIQIQDYIRVRATSGEQKDKLMFVKQPILIQWKQITKYFRPTGFLNRIVTTNTKQGVQTLPSGAVVKGITGKPRINVGPDPVHQVSSLCLVISPEIKTACVMDLTAYNTNLVQLLLVGQHDESLYELIHRNEHGRLYRIRR